MFIIGIDSPLIGVSVRPLTMDALPDSSAIPPRCASSCLIMSRLRRYGAAMPF